MIEIKDTIDLITQYEDFENIEKFNQLNDKDKEYVWEYAKRKFNDYLMQDYNLCLESCVRDALSIREFKRNDWNKRF